MEFDSSVTQDDIDASGLGAAQESFGPSGFSSDMGDGGSAEDFNSFVTGLTPQQAYTTGRGATATNPYPESIFSRIFGAENVNYSNILNTPGGYTPAGINQLRFDQSQNPDNFQMGDFYIGQDTTQGIVKETPRTGIAGVLADNIPYVSTIANILGRNRGLPELSSRFQDSSAKAQESQGELTDMINDVLGIFSSSTGQKAMNDMRNNVDMNNRTYDMFGDRSDTRQIGDFSQEGAEIPNFMTNPVARIPVVNTLARQSFFPRPMDPTGYFREGNQLRTLLP